VEAVAPIAVAFKPPERWKPERRLIAIAVHEENGKIGRNLPEALNVGSADGAATPPRKLAD
jgi:hypothetical protein